MGEASIHMGRARVGGRLVYTYGGGGARVGEASIHMGGGQEWGGG